MPQGLQVLQETKTFYRLLGLESLLIVSYNARLYQCVDDLFCQDTSLPTLAALLTLSSLPALWTNTEAGFDSWRIAVYIVSPEGRVSNGSSSVQLRTALFSAPMTAFVAGAESKWKGHIILKQSWPDVTQHHSPVSLYKCDHRTSRHSRAQTCSSVLAELELCYEVPSGLTSVLRWPASHGYVCPQHLTHRNNVAARQMYQPI